MLSAVAVVHRRRHADADGYDSALFFMTLLATVRFDDYVLLLSLRCRYFVLRLGAMPLRLYAISPLT